MIATEARSRIAVFIDFDNVEIGVKSTIGGQFDIGLVLEAIKERGEIVTKIAYSDWKRVGDYSRLLTQHAIRMVQRNMTPGGDKNGADITMALDALEMAFTHDHINAFVIVGGDSDFISLVEKLKQYGRRVIVVGGRQFTSLTMQRNCHEFIAYENLVGVQTSHRRQSDRGGRQAPATAGGGSPIANALPLVLRALKVLSEREVTPQLGLLKSTLLQLDSTFSEREYGASSFRDFMEKVAQTGAVELKHAGRSMLVEAVSGAAEAAAAAAPPAVQAETPAPRRGSRRFDVEGNGIPADAEADTEDDDETLPPSPMSMQDGIKAVQQAFHNAAASIRWPMYVRQARQFLRSGGRRLRRAQVRLRVGGRSAARGGQGRRVPDRARSPGRGARVPGHEPRAQSRGDGGPAGRYRRSRGRRGAGGTRGRRGRRDRSADDRGHRGSGGAARAAHGRGRHGRTLDGRRRRGRRRRPAARQRAAPAGEPRPQDARPPSPGSARSRAPRAPRGAAAKTARPRSRKTQPSSVVGAGLQTAARRAV